MFISVPAQMELKCMLNDYINNGKRVDDACIVRRRVFREIINFFIVYQRRPVHGCFPHVRRLSVRNIYDTNAHVVLFRFFFAFYGVRL